MTTEITKLEEIQKELAVLTVNNHNLYKAKLISQTMFYLNRLINYLKEN